MTIYDGTPEQVDHTLLKRLAESAYLRPVGDLETVRHEHPVTIRRMSRERMTEELRPHPQLPSLKPGAWDEMLESASLEELVEWHAIQFPALTQTADDGGRQFMAESGIPTSEPEHYEKRQQLLDSLDPVDDAEHRAVVESVPPVGATRDQIDAVDAIWRAKGSKPVAEAEPESPDYDPSGGLGLDHQQVDGQPSLEHLEDERGILATQESDGGRGFLATRNIPVKGDEPVPERELSWEAAMAESNVPLVA